MADYCITTLSCGKKYNEYLKKNLLSSEKILDDDVDVFVTTDEPDFFNDIKIKGRANLIVKKFSPEPKLPDVRSKSKKTWFNYHQKRLAIENAFNSGYNKIFYIDSDIKIINWDKDFFLKKEKGFWFRTMLSRDQHIEKYKLYDTLYNVDMWHYYRPVSEKIMYINECADKIRGFISVWKHLEIISQGKVNPYSEGHEILISLRFNGASVNRYKPDPFKGESKYFEDAHL